MQQQLQLYDVLLRRAICSPQQLASLQSTYHALLAGHTGEKRVLFELKELTFPHSVIHNFISFNQVRQKVQIDIVLICQHFVLVLEVKNITGRIDFDDKRRQFIRTRPDGQQESFMNPVDQVKRHVQQVEQLLVADSNFIPVVSAVVIANHNTIIGRLSGEVPIFNVSGLRTFVGELCKKYAHVQVNMRRVVSVLKAAAVEERFEPPKILEQLEIRRGVLCATCGREMVIRNRGFKCMKCHTWDVDDLCLKKSLADYKRLYGNEITNKAFRQFFHLQNPSTANKYLCKLQLPFKGKNKGRKYFLDSF